MPACSRWLSEATPPDMAPQTTSHPGGVPAWTGTGRWRRGHAGGLGRRCVLRDAAVDVRAPSDGWDRHPGRCAAWPWPTAFRPRNGSRRGFQNEERALPSGRMGSRSGTQGLTMRVGSWWVRRGCRPGPLTRRTGHAASPSPREGTRHTDCPTAVSRLMDRAPPKRGRPRVIRPRRRLRPVAASTAAKPPPRRRRWSADT